MPNHTFCTHDHYTYMFYIYTHTKQTRIILIILAIPALRMLTRESSWLLTFEIHVVQSQLNIYYQSPVHICRKMHLSL